MLDFTVDKRNIDKASIFLQEERKLATQSFILTNVSEIYHSLYEAHIKYERISNKLVNWIILCACTGYTRAADRNDS